MNFYVEVIERQANDLAETIGRLQDTFLKDKSQPIKDRWEAYIVVEEFLPNQGYGSGYIDKLGWDSPYDDLGIERHETRKFSTVLEQIDENLWYLAQKEEDPEDEFYEKYRSITPEMLNNWKETVLASGYGSFTWDW